MNIDANQKLDAILEAIKILEERITRIEGGNLDSISRSQIAAAKKMSIKEFLLESPPTTDVQRTLAIGFFLEKHSGMSSFTKGELEKGYSDAKEPAPSNMSMNIKRCIQQGHMMKVEEDKNNKTAYVVTRSGEQFVVAGYKKTSGRK